LSSAKKLHLYHLVQLVSPVIRGLRTADFPIFEIWSPGDDPRELSLLDTIRLYGILVPGVFAVKRRELVRGKRAKSVVILMDCSGSTGLNMTIGREREAAFGIIQAAREYGDIVSFIPFSTDVKFDNSILYSKDYDELEDAVIKVETGGYSNIASALSMALRTGDMAGRQIVFAMTDGRVWDSEEAVGLVNKLTEYGKVAFFIFGTGVGGMPEEAQDMMRGSVVYECDPKIPMIDQALQEYLG
jgi:Mg-chelatase subunit ChlD